MSWDAAVLVLQAEMHLVSVDLVALCNLPRVFVCPGVLCFSARRWSSMPSPLWALTPRLSGEPSGSFTRRKRSRR